MKIKIVIVLLVLSIPVMVMAQDMPDLSETVQFVAGDSTSANFVNSILNDIQGLFLSVIAPAAGLVIVGRNLFKRGFPKNENSEIVGLAIMGILFMLYKFANAAGAAQELQAIVDALTQLGQAFALGGVTLVASSVGFRVSKAHDSTVFGFERPASNG